MARFSSACWNLMVSFVGKFKASLNATKTILACLPCAKATPEVSTPLPEELVERILAMLPFPQIFKARILSKSWHARLSSISSQDDEERKHLAMSFQKQVCEWSDRWSTFCPVYLFDHNFLIAYDSASNNWLRIPILSVIPDREAITVKAYLLDHLHQCSWSSFWSIVGALLLVGSSHNMLVVNIFTGSWKELPVLPHGSGWKGTRTRLVSSKELYKVIELHTDAGCVCASIYDPKLGAWRSKRVEVLGTPQGFKLGRYDAYLNGVVYIIVSVRQTVWGILAFNVKDETFNLLQMPSTDMISIQNTPSLQLVACNGAVYIVVRKDCSTVSLLEVDLVSRRWTKVTRSPPVSFKFDIFWGHALRSTFSNGDCIFFNGNPGTNCSDRKIMAYNVRKDEWSSTAMKRIYCHSFSPSDSSFQPGMNPFLEV